MISNESGLEQCKQLIEASLGWGDASSWTNEDFDTLSGRIFDKTSVRLSVSTLKRIWGKVKYDSSPTTATLNALTRYAGFESWRDFMAARQPAPTGQGSPLPQSLPVAAPPSATRHTPAPQPSPAPGLRTATPLIIITVALGVLLSFIGARIRELILPAVPPSPSETAAATLLKFENRRTSDELPNSVVFDYDATPLHPKAVMIQQSWDPKRREKVDPNGKQHTSIYYYPGYFYAKLIVDGEMKKQSEVFVPTKGWKGIVGRSPLPVYLSAAESRVDSGRMGIAATTLEAKTGSPVFSGMWVTFADVHEFPGIAGDHFMLKATVRNTSAVEQCLCRNVQITLLGKESAIIIPLSDKGCISGLGLLTGFTGVSGKDHDLSAFGCDFNNWQQVTCTEEDRVLNIWLNNRLIYTVTAARSIGDIVGLRFAFEGTGAVKEAVLKGSGDPIDLLKHP